jgi:hypothetical protein
VPELAGGPGGPAQQPGVGDDAHPHSGPDAHEREVVDIARVALGQRGEVDVVLQRHRHAQRVLEQPPQRRTGEGSGARDHAREAVAFRDARHAHRRRAHRLAADGGGDRLRQLRAGRRHRPVHAPHDALAGAECDAQVGGAEVRAEHEYHESYPR